MVQTMGTNDEAVGTKAAIFKMLNVGNRFIVCLVLSPDLLYCVPMLF